MKKIIVSGASGFLGSALVRNLANSDIKIFALVSDLSKIDSSNSNIGNIEYICINLNCIGDLCNSIKDKDIDVFYHFAWEGSSGKSRSDYKTQVRNIYNVCETITAAAKIGCKKFVFAESIMEYEIKKAIDLSTDISLSTLYSTSKLASKYMAKALCQNYNIDYIGALISNVYGPGEKSERLINWTLRKLNNREHCSFSSCEQLYDFIYIDDAVEILKLIGAKGRRNESYYIGNTKQKKLKEFIYDICGVIFKNNEEWQKLIGIGELNNPTTVLDYNEFDVSKVYNEFGYIPKTSFEEGIFKTYKYIKGG